MCGNRPVGAALDEEVLPDRVDVLLEHPALLVDAGEQQVQQAWRFGLAVRGLAQGGRQPRGDGWRAHAAAPSTIGSGSRTISSKRAAGRRSTSAPEPGTTRLVTPTTPSTRCRTANTSERSSGCPSARWQRSERTVGIERASPAWHPTPPPRHGAESTASTTSIRTGGSVEHRRAHAERHGRVAPRVQEAGERADLVRVGARAARPGRRAGTPGAGPEPPHAQPGGPEPVHAAACVTPGYPRLRSTRSSIADRAPEGRGRGRARARADRARRPGRPRRSSGPRPRPSSRRGRCRAGC